MYPPESIANSEHFPFRRLAHRFITTANTEYHTANTSAEMTATNTQEKIALIKQGLQEVLKENIISDVIEKEGRPLKIYWGKSRTRQSTYHTRTHE